jgi:dihydroxyacetone kinase-like protein
VKDSTYTVGRRGVAGNFFVIKAVGAASEQGADLDELLCIGNKVNAVTRTMGMALTSCTPPAKGSPLFELGDEEMERGLLQPHFAPSLPPGPRMVVATSRP